MTDEQERRAVAWLDAHPQVVERATTASWGSDWGPTPRGWHKDDIQCALVAFLTTPLPCARCGGASKVGGVVHGTNKLGEHHSVPATVKCPDCTDGTAGILLDQLEARYEQVGWLTIAANRTVLGHYKEGPYGTDDEPVFRKLPSPEEE